MLISNFAGVFICGFQVQMRALLKVLLSLLLFFLIKESAAQKVGLVLSGGGVRGFAHIGVIKALEENGIPIDYITGTSAGALVGSSYITGRTPAEIEKIFTSQSFLDYGRGLISEDLRYFYLSQDPDPSWISIKLGIDSTLKIKFPRSVINSAPADFALLENYVQASAKAGYNFDHFLVPFRCVAADIKARKQVTLKNGDLAQAVRASMAFPLYFSPLTVDNRILFDGGIYDNIPIDVMRDEFNPDIIIAVNAAGDPEIPSDDNLLSQIKNIFVATEDTRLLRDSDLLILPNINSISVFQFEYAQAAIDSGYMAAMRMMPLIKERIGRRVSESEMEQKREIFRSGQHPVFIDRIFVNGLNVQQQAYVRKVLNPSNDCISLNELKKRFFLLAQDEQLLYVFPKVIFNEATGYYDLYIDSKREGDLLIDLGGNFSSKPINNAYVGFQFNLLGKQSLKFSANNYFGKLYNSGMARLKMDIPGHFRFYLESAFSKSQFDYFRSSSTFYEDVKPSYLVINETNTEFSVGVPVRNKGKLTTTASYLINRYNYYQTLNFSKADTADQSSLTAFSPAVKYERSSIDRKQFPTQGTYFSFAARLVTGKLNYIPGSLSQIRDTSVSSKRWIQARMIYDNYFSSYGRLKFGVYGDLFMSGQPLFDTYESTVLSTAQFEPTPEAKTLFLPQFRAQSFIGLGLKSVLVIFSNLNLRLEGYIYQPVQEIIKRESGKARYGEALQKRYFIANSTLVFHNPLGPISFQVSYYQGREKPLSILFCFGYILFNKRTLE